MNEKELIKKTLNGDEAAFNLLVEKNRDIVYRHCLSIVKNEEAAKDLMQDAFVHAFQHLNSFRMEARFSTWLWRITHNLCLSYLKKKHPIEHEFKEEIAPANFFRKKENDEEFLVAVQRAAQQLPEKHRIVFEMYDLKRIPQKQIAAELNIPHGTVRSRLHYARRSIRKMLIT